MSSTRRVKQGARREQNGWASAVEFDDLRGINGTAVAMKAKLIEDPARERLLYFLQAVSLRIGAKGIARELIEMFPQRLATPTMFRIGCKPGKRLTQAERDAIDEELNGGNTVWELLDKHRDADSRERCQKSADDFITECRARSKSGLADYLERICCDPTIVVTESGEEASSYRKIARAAYEDAGCEEQVQRMFETAALEYFHDLLGALFEYQVRYEKRVRENFVKTSIGEKVFEALDYALETGRSAFIEGNAGIGKSESTKAWTEMHLGEARRVELKGITHRTGFFREIARACGLARGTGLSPAKIQMRVEHFLQRTKIMLIIDEGQYLMPPGNRVYTPPELVNWLLTACYNEGVPFAISATSEFRHRRAIIEKNTTWQSEQMRRRIRRFFVLPEVPTKDDLFNVAQKMLPDLGRTAVEYVVGYSLMTKGFFQAIRDAIEDARLMARRADRDTITFDDLKAAIQDWRSPSDAVQQRVFVDKAKGRAASRQAAIESAEPVQESPVANERLNDRSAAFKGATRQEISSVLEVAEN